MAEIQERIRERLRARLIRYGASPAFQDPALFADVEQLLRAAAGTADANALLLPEVLGNPDTWRLDPALRYRSHRGPAAAGVLIFLKRRVVMPALRWLFEYSHDNFARQQRVNQVLFACVQELAIETARLRQDVQRLPASTSAGDAGSDAPSSR
jgi:hypothetical protein